MNQIFVTKPSLPNLEDVIPYLEKIWESKILTNNGTFHKQFEEELCEFLGVKYISLFCNGTSALITALQALHVTGEVITTPYSFVATTHALWWNGIKPVFIDIEPNSFTIDPKKIESAISEKTSAILPVHVYGNPCNVEVIKNIAEKYGLKVIYDACHTFNVRVNDIPIVKYGDLSVMSFHATKVFNTFEGGAIICHSEEMKNRIDNLKNFGFTNETSVVSPGINAKMNEFQSVIGILQLKRVHKEIEKRKNIATIYRNELKNVYGLSLPDDIPGVNHCYSYFPILIQQNKSGMKRDDLYKKLAKNQIFCRRYFYPLISKFPPYESLDSANADNLPIAEKIAKEVICLPLYSELEEKMVYKICSLICNSLT